MAVDSYIAFSVLVWIEGSGVDVDVRVKFLNGHSEATCFKQAGQ